MNPSNAWNAKLEAGIFFGCLKIYLTSVSSSACMRDICIKTFTNDITEPMESLKIWGETKSKGDIISEIVQFFSISIKLCHITSRGFLSRCQIWVGDFFSNFYGTLRMYWLVICHIFWKLSEINPSPTRLCHVIYCCSDKSYPCLVWKGVKQPFWYKVFWWNRVCF